MDLPASAALLVVAVALLTVGDVFALPTGMLLATWALATGQPLLTAAALGTGGAVVGRALLARQGLRAGSGSRELRSDRARANREQMHAFLASNTRYAALTFGMAMLPLQAARSVFPLLGEMRMPIRYALAGTVFGQLPALLVTTWLFRGVARALTGDDRDAAMLLALLAIVWVVGSAIDRLDVDEWRRSRRLRVRRRDEAAWTSFTVAGMGGGLGGAVRDPDAGDGDVIEGEVVDDDGERGQLAPGDGEDRPSDG